MHKHKCLKCHAIWGHDEARIARMTDSEHTQAHACPKCFTPQYDKYYGPEAVCHEVCLMFPSRVKVSVLAHTEQQAAILALLMSDHATSAEAYGVYRSTRCVLGGVVSETVVWELTI